MGLEFSLLRVAAVGFFWFWLRSSVFICTT